MSQYLVMIASGSFGSNKQTWHILKEFDNEQEAIDYKDSWLNPCFSNNEVKVVEIK